MLKRLSFVICVGCPRKPECDAKITKPPECEKHDLINGVVEELSHWRTEKFEVKPT